jgi:hypothetical protein
VFMIMQTGLLKRLLVSLMRVDLINRDSSVCIVTDHTLDGRGSIIDRGKRSFSSPQCPDRLRGPPIQWVPGASFPAGKAVGE